MYFSKNEQLIFKIKRNNFGFRNETAFRPTVIWDIFSATLCFRNYNWAELSFFAIVDETYSKVKNNTILSGKSWNQRINFKFGSLCK